MLSTCISKRGVDIVKGWLYVISPTVTTPLEKLKSEKVTGILFVERDEICAI